MARSVARGGAGRRWGVRLIAPIVFLAGCASGGGAAKAPEAKPGGPAPSGKTAEQLYVIDCLLPAQIRKLGAGLTFLGPRRAIKTSASDCEIRGGEYVAYDRADYATALRVWLPQAQEGDLAAQVYVGEIYEKGLGVPPDYGMAAAWYRKAAERGFSRAQIDLGNLYEKGLGVERDPIRALEWYRKASGLADAIALDTSGLATENRQELSALRAEVDRQRRESEQLRAQLEAARRQVDEARRELERRSMDVEAGQQRVEALRRELDQAKAEVGAARDDSKVRALTDQLDQREGELERERQEVTRLHQRVSSLESSAAQDSQALRTQLEAARRQLDEARAELARRSTETEAGRQQVEALRRELDQAKAEVGAARDDSKVRALTAQLGQRESELEQQRQEVTRLRQRVSGLEAEATREREAGTRAGGEKVAMAGPTIEMVEPSLLGTRGVSVVKVALPQDQTERMIVGRVSAPSGVLVVMVNDREQTVDDNGLFRTRIPVKASGSQVRVVAIDRQGLRSNLEFQLAPDEGSPAAAPARKIPSVLREGGRYALVIGNRAYEHWPSLKTTEADARETATLLERRYGFKTRTLLNAKRFDILQAMNELRNQLTEKDWLVIYYAGHGYLDEKINRAYWVPVDGALDSNTEWISTVAITDLIGAMSANHVLLVVDSCYSGALTRSALARLEAGSSAEARQHWLEVVATKRSRTVLSSGDLKPVLDSGGGQHSVFARAWLDVLGKNDDVLEGQRLYREIAARVAYAADALRFEQVPQYAPIRYAGHESGDFLFVPRDN
jgi:predicted  nucleic acid-binding Zn-ribbon protein